MPGPLTDDEKAQILDHLGWANSLHAQDYPFTTVTPILNGLQDEARLSIVRGHLARLNAIYTEQESIISKFKLYEVKGIKFHTDAESRLWAQYSDWVAKLGASLDVVPNPNLSGRRRGGRPIL